MALRKGPQCVFVAHDKPCPKGKPMVARRRPRKICCSR